jgi:hypothetical protein
MIIIFLTLVSLFNVGFGLWVMLDPVQVMEMMLTWQTPGTAVLPDRDLIQPATIGEFRALLGGLILALGLVTLRCLRSPEYAIWLQPLAWVFLGLALARFSSLMLDGISTYTIVAASIEVATAWALGVQAQRLQSMGELPEEEFEEEELEEY